MTVTYPSAILSHMTDAIIGGITGITGKMSRIRFHATFDGSRAVVRDLSCGQDYEITVKPI